MLAAAVALAILIPLAKFGLKAVFWILAFADFVILAGLAVYFAHLQWAWHTVFVVLAVAAVMSAYYGVLRLPVVKYILPACALGFVSWILVRTFRCAKSRCFAASASIFAVHHQLRERNPYREPQPCLDCRACPSFSRYSYRGKVPCGRGVGLGMSK